MRSSTGAKTARSGTASFDIARFSKLLYDEQSRMCTELERLDGSGVFSADAWKREDGSKGLSRVMQGGSIWEKAGVNISVVTGVLSEERAGAMRARGRECDAGVVYNAAALSFVLHANSPFVPTLRGDVRVFAAGGEFWGGGGVDLTVFYVDEAQISAFHRFWKDACDAFDPTYYTQFKDNCDRYFYLPFRGESRGVGGLFYDELELEESKLVAFQRVLLTGFIPSFQPILNSNRGLPYSEEQKRWQRIRRGRYLEFNLLQDRGVRFGVAGATPSRFDSIMISAPPSIEWPYAHKPDVGSPEADTIALLTSPPRSWASL